MTSRLLLDVSWVQFKGVVVFRKYPPPPFPERSQKGDPARERPLRYFSDDISLINSSIIRVNWLASRLLGIKCSLFISYVLTKEDDD